MADEIDGIERIDSDDIIPCTHDPVIFDQTVKEEVCVANALTSK